MIGEKTTAYFITNCGILLKNEKHSILIDALYRYPPDLPAKDYGHTLTAPSDKVRDDIMNRAEIFSDVDLILFTHTHWDHADPVLAGKYSKKYHVPVFYPAKTSEGDGMIFCDESLQVERFSSFHDIPSNPDEKIHCCYRVTLSGKSYLFTGDLDITRPVPSALGAKPLDGMFFNVHHILTADGRALIKDFFKPERLYIQHLPNPDFDIYNLRKRLENKLKLYGHELPPYKVLTEDCTRIF